MACYGKFDNLAFCLTCNQCTKMKEYAGELVARVNAILEEDLDVEQKEN